GDRVGPVRDPIVAHGRPRNRFHRGPERVGDLAGPPLVAARDEQAGEPRGVEELAGGADRHLAGAHQEHRGHRNSGPSSSRHPPDVEGTLPFARRRTTTPAATAIAATRRPRRNAFIAARTELGSSWG